MAARKTLYIVFATLTTTISSFLMEWLVSAKTGILASVIRRRLEMDTLEAVGMVLFLLDLCLSILAIPLLICILFLV